MSRFPWTSTALLMWRLDTVAHASAWDKGIGAHLGGGRWNPRGMAVVYCSVDPSTAILEVAVHKTFDTLARVPHLLSCAELLVPDELHIIRRQAVPDASWLKPGLPTLAQQQFGFEQLSRFPFIAVSSAVSEKSWNIVFNPALAAGKFRLLEQSKFSFDARLSDSS